VIKWLHVVNEGSTNQTHVTVSTVS